MVSNSPIFLFAFLPLALLGYHLIPGVRGKNAFLIVASLIFYAFGSLQDLWLLIGSAVLHYLAGLALLRLKKGRKLVLAATVVLDVGLLLYCKFALWLPLGISFFTFQAISYVVDAYRDPKDAGANFREVLQYITFFPQLLSGPLMKFSRVRPFLGVRRVDAEELSAGMRRFTVGLAKKLLLSAAAAGLADAVYALPVSVLDIRTAWLGAVCYSVQLFFDFSGYSDMAIGLGKMFGYTLPENFNYPYAASSVTDFWRRWHISLSSWFRDYLYIPLGGNRKGKTRTMLNKLIVFFATGLWHGTGLTYILWGLWHGFWSLLETALQLPKKLEKRWYGHVYALLVAVIGFVMFRAESVAQGLGIIGNMFAGFRLTAESSALFVHEMSLRSICLLVFGLILSLPVAPYLAKRLQNCKLWPVLRDVLTIVLLLVCILTLASSSFQPFIYFQF